MTFRRRRFDPETWRILRWLQSIAVSGPILWAAVSEWPSEALAEERTYEAQWKAIGIFHPNGTRATEIYADEPVVYILEATIRQTAGPEQIQEFEASARPFNPQGASDPVRVLSGTPARIYIWVPPGTRSTNRYPSEVFPRVVAVHVPQGDAVKLTGQTDGYWIPKSYYGGLPQSWTEDDLGPTGSSDDRHARWWGVRKNIPEGQHAERLLEEGDSYAQARRQEIDRALNDRLRRRGSFWTAVARAREGDEHALSGFWGHFGPEIPELDAQQRKVLVDLLAYAAAGGLQPDHVEIHGYAETAKKVVSPRAGILQALQAVEK